jgi:hypothetical protein
MGGSSGMSKTVPSQPYVVNTQHQNLLCTRFSLVGAKHKIAIWLEQTRFSRLTARRIIRKTIGFKIATGGENRLSFILWQFSELEVIVMCRNIKTLFNFDPPVTPEEIQAASLQFVRKISGFNKPSNANEPAFLAAVDEVADVATRLLGSLKTHAPARNREEEAAKAKARAAERFGV